MAFVIKDFVQETTSTSGTGTYTLSGNPPSYQPFSVIGDGNTTAYGISDGANREVGIGTYTLSGTTLARTKILASTNGGSAVSWGSTLKQIFCMLPAELTLLSNGYNYLINGGMQFWNRAAGGPGATSPTITPAFAGPNTQDIYTTDRCKGNNQAATSHWVASRQTGGPNSPYYTKWLNSTAADKLLLYQIIESPESIALSTGLQTITAQKQFRMPAGTLVKGNVAIGTWTGTADTFPATGITTAWTSGSASDPSLATGLTANGKTSLLATSSFQQLSTTFTLAAGVNNILLMFWLDAQTSSIGEVDTTEWALTVSPAPVPWNPRLSQEELALCNRFCWAPDTASGTTPAWALGFTSSTTASAYQIQNPVVMRAVPTLTVTPSDWSDNSTGGTVALTNLVIGGGSTTKFFTRLNGTTTGLTANLFSTLLVNGANNKVAYLSAEL